MNSITYTMTGIELEITTNIEREEKEIVDYAAAVYSYILNQYEYRNKTLTLGQFADLIYKSFDANEPHTMKVVKVLRTLHNRAVFHAEYELALSIGNKRFGSECNHIKVIGGRCSNCLRQVVSGRIV